MAEWKVMPTRGTSWQVVTPEGDVIQCVTDGLAIDLGTKLAHDHHGLLLVYGSDGRVLASEDFRPH